MSSSSGVVTDCCPGQVLPNTLFGTGSNVSGCDCVTFNVQFTSNGHNSWVSNTVPFGNVLQCSNHTVTLTLKCVSSAICASVGACPPPQNYCQFQLFVQWESTCAGGADSTNACASTTLSTGCPTASGGQLVFILGLGANTCGCTGAPSSQFKVVITG